MKLSSLHKALLYSLGGVLYLSGALWMLLHAGLLRWDPLGSAGLEVKHYLLVTHGVVSMPFLIVLGSLIPVHMKKGWAAKRSVRSGTAMVLTNLVLLLTAAALYYVGDESWRAMSSVIHRSVGAIVVVLLLLHLRAARGRETRALT